MRKYLHFWASEIALFGIGAALDLSFERLSPMFWVGIIAVAVFVAFRTWPSAIEEGASADDNLRFVEERHKFILIWFENFWGLALLLLIFAFVILVRLVWVWTS